ncbi:hypothetical protein Tco_1165324 [Tanacetum coccineum]
MADNRTMAQMLQAPIEGYEDAIVVPPINANNFELKAYPLINLVQAICFSGRHDPHNHIRFFNKVTSTFRHPEVPIHFDQEPRGLAIIESKSKVRLFRSRFPANDPRGYNGNRNVNQTSQVNHGANSALSQQAQAYQVPSTQAPVTYSRFEAYTTANDATLNNLQKNLNEFKKEQQDFQK